MCYNSTNQNKGAKMRLTKRLLSELKQYKELNLKAGDLVKITKEIQG